MYFLYSVHTKKNNMEIFTYILSPKPQSMTVNPSTDLIFTVNVTVVKQFKSSHILAA